MNMMSLMEKNILRADERESGYKDEPMGCNGGDLPLGGTTDNERQNYFPFKIETHEHPLSGASPFRSLLERKRDVTDFSYA